MQQITPCLWFDHQAAEPAARFYATVFEHSKIEGISYYTKSAAEVSGQKEGSILTVDFALENLRVQALNGGPLFKFTPSLSLSVSCSSVQEIEETWKKLSDGGNVRMGLDKYPWADRYGWTADRYGVEWQLILAPRTSKIVPAFLFVDQLFGKGEEAIKFYVSLFPKAKIETIDRDEASKTVRYAEFSLNGQSFVLMEGAGRHGHTFSEAFSLTVNCDDQKEIDFYWDKLCAGGTPSQCGWLKDKFGVSWQIVPDGLEQLMTDPVKAERMMKVMIDMTKLDKAKILQAAQG